MFYHYAATFTVEVYIGHDIVSLFRDVTCSVPCSLLATPYIYVQADSNTACMLGLIFKNRLRLNDYAIQTNCEEDL